MLYVPHRSPCCQFRASSRIGSAACSASRVTPTSAPSHASTTSSAATSCSTYWKQATHACTSGASNSRVSPLITYGIDRRRSSSTSSPASLDTERNSTAKSDQDSPRGCAPGSP